MESKAAKKRCATTSPLKLRRRLITIMPRKDSKVEEEIRKAQIRQHHNMARKTLAQIMNVPNQISYEDRLRKYNNTFQ